MKEDQMLYLLDCELETIAILISEGEILRAFELLSELRISVMFHARFTRVQPASTIH